MAMSSLIGPRVELRPLRASDAPAIVAAASDGALWELPFTVVPSAATVDDYIGRALAGEAAGTVAPFVTVVRADGRLVGSTRFWKIDPVNRKLEIGSTWLAASWQRSFVNTEAKYLMLRHAFETWNCLRVELKTDSMNQRSRRAILRLGAKEEGTLRKHMLTWNGRQRDSVYFSILDTEWPGVKSDLERKVQR